jgi:hypothetical protein
MQPTTLATGFRRTSSGALFLFLLGRNRNFRERGGGRGDLRFVLFRFLSFAVTTNLTFRHRNSLLRRLAGGEHHHPGTVASVKISADVRAHVLDVPQSLSQL